MKKLILVIKKSINKLIICFLCFFNGNIVNKIQFNEKKLFFLEIYKEAIYYWFFFCFVLKKLIIMTELEWVIYQYCLYFFGKKKLNKRKLNKNNKFLTLMHCKDCLYIPVKREKKYLINYQKIHKNGFIINTRCDKKR